MTSQVTSFHKKIGSRIPYIPGTKPSIQNAQLLTSTGVPSLDFLFGGGIPVGSLILVDEDVYGSFSKLLLKFFLAEGVVSHHDILVASQDSRAQLLVEELPVPVDKGHKGASKDQRQFPNAADEKMNIAWRYQNLPSVDFTDSEMDFGHYFDISKVMDVRQIAAVNAFHWSGTSENLELEGNNSPFADLLSFIRKHIKDGQFNLSDSPKKRNLLRVGIHSLGSPLWGSAYSDLFLFLYYLRSVLRSAYCICMVTVPAHLFVKPSVIQRCQHLSDIAVRLESFSGSDKETNTVFKDYHGLFHIDKLPALNSLSSYVPGSFDLAFKLRRKKFSVEILHLPPEIQETKQREQDEIKDTYRGPSARCGSTQRRVLDF